MPPQEGIKANETPEAAAIRCLKVELGIPEDMTHFRRTIWLGCKKIPEQHGGRDIEHSVTRMRGKAYYAGLIKVDDSTRVVANPAELADFAWLEIDQIRERLMSNSEQKQHLLRQAFQKLCGISI
jgi:isopentenyldiphosphate isomerase